MWDFLAEFAQKDEETYTVLVMDEDRVAEPRRYQVNARHVQWLWGGSVVGVAVLLLGLLMLTPVPRWLFGVDGTVREAARLNAVRVAALADSIQAQQQYIEHMQGLLTGRIDTAEGDAESARGTATQATPEAPATEPSPDESGAQSDHQQPALPVARLPARGMASNQPPVPMESALSSLQPPMRPPVDGFPTRSFNARSRHYAVDIAVEKGTPVRAVGDGYVILSDWMQDGGFTIAVQHADGFVSVYKHNERLLKQVGDRVRNQETIAVSGNSGEITTGPHLHFELWHEGLAQDPQAYVVGW